MLRCLLVLAGLLAATSPSHARACPSDCLGPFARDASLVPPARAHARDAFVRAANVHDTRRARWTARLRTFDGTAGPSEGGTFAWIEVERRAPDGSAEGFVYLVRTEGASTWICPAGSARLGVGRGRTEAHLTILEPTAAVRIGRRRNGPLGRARRPANLGRWAARRE